MASVTLGNVSHTALIRDPETGETTRFRSAHIEQSVTQTGSLPEGLFDAMKAVIDLWRHESDQPPAWVESDSEPLAATLREHFRCGPMPEDWEIKITGPPNMVPVADLPAPAPELAVPEAPTPAAPAEGVNPVAES